MASTGVKRGHFLAKVLGIKLNNGASSDDLTRGESIFSVQTADSFVEPEPTSAEWIQDLIPSGHDSWHMQGLSFPSLTGSVDTIYNGS